MFGAHVAIPAQIWDKVSHRQAKFPRIPSLKGQNYLEGKGQWKGKVYGWTDGRMDRRTGAGNDNTPSAWKAKGYKLWEPIRFEKSCWTRDGSALDKLHYVSSRAKKKDTHQKINCRSVFHVEHTHAIKLLHDCKWTEWKCYPKNFTH